MSNYENKVLQTVAPAFDGYKVKNIHELEKIVRDCVYDDIIQRIGCSMFKWHLPEYVLNDVPSDFIELAINCGCAAFYKVPDGVSVANGGKWACTPVKFVETKNNIGTSKHFITKGTDYSVTNEELQRYVIIKNNAFMSSEYDNTHWFAQMLNNTDIAERALIKWCRVTPIAKATSGIDGTKLREVLKLIWDGVEPFGIIDDDTKLITKSPCSEYDNVLKLTDENIVEKLHFLSEFHYELVRRLCNLYNIPFHTTAKSAQNNESELHNTDIFSKMLTTGREDFRKIGAEEIKKVFPEFEADTPGGVRVELGDNFKDENRVIENNIDDSDDEPKETEPKETEPKDGDNNA